MKYSNVVTIIMKPMLSLGLVLLTLPYLHGIRFFTTLRFGISVRVPGLLRLRASADLTMPVGSHRLLHLSAEAPMLPHVSRTIGQHSQSGDGESRIDCHVSLQIRIQRMLGMLNVAMWLILNFLGFHDCRGRLCRFAILAF